MADSRGNWSCRSTLSAIWAEELLLRARQEAPGHRIDSIRPIHLLLAAAALDESSLGVLCLSPDLTYAALKAHADEIGHDCSGLSGWNEARAIVDATIASLPAIPVDSRTFLSRFLHRATARASGEVALALVRCDVQVEMLRDRWGRSRRRKRPAIRELPEALRFAQPHLHDPRVQRLAHIWIRASNRLARRETSSPSEREPENEIVSSMFQELAMRLLIAICEAKSASQDSCGPDR